MKLLEVNMMPTIVCDLRREGMKQIVKMSRALG